MQSILSSRILDEFSSILKTSLPEPKIETVSFNNFKGFGEHLQTFEVKPITLIYAPNSVGKSSFQHSMVQLQYFALKHFEKSIISIDKTSLFGDEIDLGGFENYIHKHNKKSEIKYIIKVSDYRLLYLKAYNSPNNIKISFWLNTLYNKLENDKIIQQIIYFFYKVLFEEYNTYNYQKNFNEQIDILKGDINQQSRDTDNSESEFLLILKKILLEIIDKYKDMRNDDLICILKDKIYQNYLQDTDILNSSKPLTIEYSIGFSGHKSIYKIDNKEFFTYKSIHKVEENNKNIKIAKEFDKIVYSKTIQYIGPLRYYPDRNFILQENLDSPSLSSSQLWSLLFARNTLREELNSWLTNKDKLKSHYKIKIDKDKKSIRFIDQRTDTEVSHKDMGLGVSQVLPVLISSYFGRNKTIAIEQPELHLHPAVQAELGDEVIKSYKNANNHFFIETHSEYLLLRIMRRMRYVAEKREDRDKELDVYPEDIAIFYIDEEDNNIFIRELRLADDGSLLDKWPGGFFEEGFKERFM